MANEITVNLLLAGEKGYLDYERQLRYQATWNAAAPEVAGGTQSIGTSYEIVTIGDISSPVSGMAWFRNVDASNWVEIGAPDGSGGYWPLVRLLPGEACIFRLGAQPWAKANSAAVKLEKMILES